MKRSNHEPAAPQHRNNRDPRRHILAVALALAIATASGAQIPESTYLSAERADGLTGLYLLQDGRVIHVLDIRDLVGGRPVLSVTEYAAGRVRGLYPQGDGSFEAGDRWFGHQSVEYRIRFDETTVPAAGLTWEEGGTTVRGHRAPLVERPVSIERGDLRIAGTLVLPPGQGPHPAVIMVHGSGPATRRVMRYMGDLLAHYGVAVLATDKRGTGDSGGNWYALSHADWAGDVEAELDFVLAHPDIDAARVGIFGNSEGGFVAPVVAARRDEVRFLVCRVCSAFPQPTTILDDQRGRLEAGDLTDAGVRKAMQLLEGLISYALTRQGYDGLVAHAESGAGQPWRDAMPPATIPAPDAAYWDIYRANLIVDPAQHYAQVVAPTLVILGESDDRILIDKHRRVFEALAAQVDLDLWVISRASHGLMTGPPGDQAYPPGLHDRIAAWVARAAGAGGH